MKNDRWTPLMFIAVWLWALIAALIAWGFLSLMMADAGWAA